MSTSMALSKSTAISLWTPKTDTIAKDTGKAVCSFLDVATTGFGRATAYNTRLEQQDAELKVHAALMGLSRDVYAILMGLDGVTDRARQVGLKILLSTHRAKDEFLTADLEREILYALLHELPPQRMLKLLDALRDGSEELGIKKANNARTRKLILRTLLGSPRLALWSVKYRTKVARSLTHAWGKRLTSIIRSILSKAADVRDSKENEILRTNITRFVGGRQVDEKGQEWKGRLVIALQSVAFVLGVRERMTHHLFKAFIDAKKDLKAGAELPPEVLEGIRGTYHPGVPKTEIIRLAADAGSMTEGQKLTVQKRAKAAGIKVEVNLLEQDAIKLYIHAFETGFTTEIQQALEKKAERAAKQFPVRFASVVVIVDASGSMAGDKTQHLRPMAASLALRDMLTKTATKSVIVYAGGADASTGDEPKLVRPSGDTSLADALVDALCLNSEAIFVVSDGYENTPAGRFAEVVDQVREMGISTPIYHLNPVMAAEAKGVRELAPEKVPTLPARDPASLGPAMVRGLIEADPVRGINALIRMVVDERKVLSCR